MIIRVKNTLDQQAQYTQLASSYAVGVGTLGVRNINAFQANWAVQVGKTGEEKSEILIHNSSAPSGTSLIFTGTTRFDHPVDSLVYAVKYDQIVFKRSTSGTAGTAVAMTNGTLTITPDSLFTQFDDTTGASSYAYKTSYRNSVTGDVSSDSVWLTPSGYSFYSLYKIRDRIRNKLYSAGFLKGDDAQINDWVNEWLERMNNTAVKVNQDYNIGTVAVSHGTNGLGTITSADFKDIRKVDFTVDGVNYYRARKIQTTDFYPNETFSEVNPVYYPIGDNVIGKKPDGVSGTAILTYYRLGTTLVYDTDELPVVMRGYSKSFVDYGLAQAYFLDNKDGKGNTLMGAAMEGLNAFKDEITPRSMSGVTYVKLEAPLGGDDFDYIF